MRESGVEVEQAYCQLLAAPGELLNLSGGKVSNLWDYACAVGGDGLLAEALSQYAGVEPAERARARAYLRSIAARELLRQRVLRGIADAFAAARTPMLLMKGAALAYTVYPAPYLRPARDIDLFVHGENVRAADAILLSMGCVRALEPDVESASMQRHYVYRDAPGVEYCIDLHWQIVNRHVFAQTLRFEDAWKASQPILALGASARSFGTADAILLACLHRVVHHQDDPDPVWLWDIHLLVGRLTTADVPAFTARAARHDLQAVVARGLNLAQARFGTHIPPAILRQFDNSDAEAGSSIWRQGRQIDFVLNDLSSLPTVRARVKLIREHLFPGLAYMHSRFPSWPRPLLLLAYLYRVARGGPQWFYRHPSG